MRNQQQVLRITSVNLSIFEFTEPRLGYLTIRILTMFNFKQCQCRLQHSFETMRKAINLW